MYLFDIFHIKSGKRTQGKDFSSLFVDASYIKNCVLLTM